MNRLESPRLILRHFTLADLPTLLAYRNDEEVARYQGWGPLSEEGARTFIGAQSVQTVAQPHTWLQLALELKSTGEHIGDLALKVDGAGQAVFGYSLSRTFQGQGFMTEAATTLLSYMFGELRLHRVAAQLDVRNTPSRRLLERLGFRLEGHLLEAYSKGEWTDEYRYALLAREWFAQAGRNG